jgi:hypothetical protein
VSFYPLKEDLIRASEPDALSEIEKTVLRNPGMATAPKGSKPRSKLDDLVGLRRQALDFLVFYNAVLLTDITRPWRSFQINESTVEILRRSVSELNIHHCGGGKCLPDDAFRQAVHLHMTLTQPQRTFNPGAEMKNMADSNHSCSDVRCRKRILYPEHKYATRRKHSYEFAQILLRKPCGHMLKDDIAVYEREACVREWQPCVRVNHIAAMRISIESDGFFNHLRRDIQSHAVGEAPGQGLREPANTASKVQGLTGTIWNLAYSGQMAHDSVSLGIPSSHKIRSIPLATRSRCIGENGAECIALSEILPIILQLVKIHGFRSHFPLLVSPARLWRGRMDLVYPGLFSVN